MRVLVVGAGSIGFNVTEQLAAEGHDVSVVEEDPELVRRINETMDVLAVVGNGASPHVLEAAGIAECDLAVAVTDSDEMNIVVCMIAREYDVATKIARIRNPDYTDEKAVLKLDRLGVDRPINPEQITVSTMRRLLEVPGAKEVVDFPDCKVTLISFRVPTDAPLIGRTLSEFGGEMEGEGFLIAAIERQEDGQPRVIIPRGEDRVRADDEIYVIMSREMLPILLPMLHRRIEKVERVVLYGATREGRQLAQAVEQNYRDVFLIEPDRALATKTAEELDRATVLCGDATNPAVLADARIETADFFVAASDDDQANLMAGLLARRAGARKVMILVNEPSHVPIVDSLDIDVVINPRLVTVGEILRHVRRESVLALSRIGDGAAEVMELVAEAGSPIVGKPLRETKFPAGALVGAVLRGDEMIIPAGDTVIQPGGKVVVFALTEAAEAVQRLFAPTSSA